MGRHLLVCPTLKPGSTSMPATIFAPPYSISWRAHSCPGFPFLTGFTFERRGTAQPSRRCSRLIEELRPAVRDRAQWPQARASLASREEGHCPEKLAVNVISSLCLLISDGVACVPFRELAERRIGCWRTESTLLMQTGGTSDQNANPRARYSMATRRRAVKGGRPEQPG